MKAIIQNNKKKKNQKTRTKKTRKKTNKVSLEGEQKQQKQETKEEKYNHQERKKELQEKENNRKQIIIRGITAQVAPTSDWIMHYFATSQLFNREKIQEVVSFFAKGHQFVKVTFQTEEEVKRILNNKNQLQKFQQYNKIYIEPKRTKEEQKKFHEERIRRKQQRMVHQSASSSLPSTMYLCN